MVMVMLPDIFPGWSLELRFIPALLAVIVLGAIRQERVKAGLHHRHESQDSPVSSLKLK
jgi:hypothetical protein